MLVFFFYNILFVLNTLNRRVQRKRNKSGLKCLKIFKDAFKIFKKYVVYDKINKVVGKNHCRILRNVHACSKQF